MPEGDRFVEIWNLVFMQFNRDEKGNLIPLQNPSIDTGMGLERIAAAMQGVHSNYEIDIFQTLIQQIKIILKINIANETPSLLVIADHIRAINFLMADGVIPANEGRGYVLRRIIRRAVRHANILGIKDPSLYKLVGVVVDIMDDAYPELEKSQKLIETLLEQEEIQFFNTLEQGLKIFNQEIQKLKQKIIAGEIVFKLYDTYGFPVDLTEDIAKEHGLTIDHHGFEKEMDKQRNQSRAASQFATSYKEKLPVSGATIFTGYEKLIDNSVINKLFKDDIETNILYIGEKGIVILDQTPLYAEAGGQIGDVGEIYSDSGSFAVEDTKRQGQVYLHYGRVTKGKLQIQENIVAQVDAITRKDIASNHSATHLLHAALREVLGNEYQVAQKGSSVDKNRLRFDFTYFEQINNLQLRDVEKIVNQQIRANLIVTTQIMSLDEAKKQGAIALFDEKYGEKVRVVSMGNFSRELCGGTHVNETGVIGLFKIVSESSVAAGVRRIEAITGNASLAWFEQSESILHNLEQLVKTSREQIFPKIAQLLENEHNLVKELNQFKNKEALNKVNDLVSSATNISGINVLATTILNVDVKTLRQTVDQLKQKLESAVIVLSTVQGDKIHLIVGITKNCINKINANDLIKYLAKQIDGSGGGRPDLAQGGGNNLQALPDALNSVSEWVKTNY